MRNKLFSIVLAITFLCGAGLFLSNESFASTSHTDEDGVLHYYVATGESYYFEMSSWTSCVSHDESIAYVEEVVFPNAGTANKNYIKITGIKAGTTTFTIKDIYNREYERKITVVDDPYDIPIGRYDNYSDHAAVGDTLSLWHEYYPNEYSFNKARSSDESVATITADGKIVAVGTGKAVIDIIYNHHETYFGTYDDYESMQITLYVSKTKPADLNLVNIHEITLQVGESVLYDVDAVDGSGYYTYHDYIQMPEWINESPDIVKLEETDIPSDRQGSGWANKIRITGLKPGTASIYATFEVRDKMWGQMKAYALVVNTVEKNPAVTNLKITKTWDDESDKDGIRPSAEEFLKKLTVLANGEEFSWIMMKISLPSAWTTEMIHIRLR